MTTEHIIKALNAVLWTAIVGFSVFLFGLTAQYLTFQPDVNFLLVKQDVVFDAIWRPTFYVHVISGMAVIVIGPFQFLKVIRQKSLSLHRRLGKIYAYGILFLAAPTGLIMAFYAEGGIPSTIAFVIMSTLWFFTTIMAIIKIKQKDIKAHQKWMYRSYALSFAAVTLRILVPVMSKYLDYDPVTKEEFIIVSTAWLSWIINLLVVEILIYFKFKPKKRLVSN